MSALSIGYAGQYAWVALLLVAGLLYLFRKIYGEVVGALPLNGGAYNVLLNTTSKSNASIAACLTILSYMATAVLSAGEAMNYLYLIAPIPHVPVLWATAGLLTFFLLLTSAGMSESAIVAVVIFVAHLAALTLLVGSGVWFVAQHGLTMLHLNYAQPVVGGSLAVALFLGFSAAMLGISGFESSANFVEEQAPGVFQKTLRNMWLVVSFFNPVIALLAVAVVPLATVGEHQETLLSYLGQQTGGPWLATVISIDAVTVLSGAVLTSFVGVSGLIKRMALDRIWPQFFLKENRRGANYIILAIFFGLSLSILAITQGELETLAGVYTISFLAVMAFFAIGNFLLKVKRGKLPRPVYASVFSVFLALIGVLAGLYGNVQKNPGYLVVFLQYFIPAALIVYAMLERIAILNLVLAGATSFYEQFRRLAIRSQVSIRRLMHELNKQEFVYFTKGDNVANLNKVMTYVEENEFTNRLKIVMLLHDGQTVPDELLTDLRVLDRAYPNMHLEFVSRPGTFGPETITSLSEEWHIPKNFMFIGSPGDRFPYQISELGAVRLII